MPRPSPSIFQHLHVHSCTFCTKQGPHSLSSCTSPEYFLCFIFSCTALYQLMLWYVSSFHLFHHHHLLTVGSRRCFITLFYTNYMHEILKTILSNLISLGVWKPAKSYFLCVFLKRFRGLQPSPCHHNLVCFNCWRQKKKNNVSSFIYPPLPPPPPLPPSPQHFRISPSAHLQHFLWNPLYFFLLNWRVFLAYLYHHHHKPYSSYLSYRLFNSCPVNCLFYFRCKQRFHLQEINGRKRNPNKKSLYLGVLEYHILEEMDDLCSSHYTIYSCTWH